MANMSDATGTIMIEANSFDVLEELKKCLEIASHWDYGTICWGLDDKEVIDEVNESSVEEMNEGDLRYYIIYKFEGAGRWNYSNNIQSFIKWLDDEKDKFNSQLLRNSNFDITFEYIDQEPGVGFITEGKKRLTHQAGDLDVFCDTLYEIDHDYTLVNKAKYTGCDLVDAMKDEFVYYEEDEGIFDILYAQKREIEQYVGEPLGAFLHENDLDNYIEIYNKFISEKNGKILKF